MEFTYLTEERHKEIINELEVLKTVGRREIAEKLKTAKELGDLSENSDYQEAKAEQARLEQKIASMENVIGKSSIIKKPKSTNIVKIGSAVVLKKDGESFEYTIVGSNEANPQGGLISNESPLGMAVLGKKVGEDVIFKTPKGKNFYKVFKIK